MTGSKYVYPQYALLQFWRSISVLTKLILVLISEIDIYLNMVAIRRDTTEKLFQNVFSGKNASVGEIDHIS